MIKQLALEPTHDKNNNFDTPFIFLSGLNSKYFLGASLNYIRNLCILYMKIKYRSLKVVIIGFKKKRVQFKFLKIKILTVLLFIIQKYFLCNLLNEIIQSSNLLYISVSNYYNLH